MKNNNYSKLQPCPKTNSVAGVSPYTPRRRPGTKAMALVGVMMVLMLILAATLIGFAKMNGNSGGDLGSTSNNTLLMAKTRINVMQAESLADTGLRAAVQWISERSKPPINTTAFTPVMVTPDNFFVDSGRTDVNKWTVVNFAPDPTTPTEGQFKVRFYPHSDNAVASQRSYLVESIGTYKGQTRVARADIKQKTFAQYAYFTDDVGPGAFIAGKTIFNGPVHVNNSNGADVNIVWDSDEPDTNKSRIFQWNGDNAFTMWNNGGANATKTKWQKDTPGNYVNPSTAANWKQVITPKDDGTARTGPTMVSDKIAMPVGNGVLKSVDQRDAALGGYSEASVPAGSGVYVPSSGGLSAAGGAVTGGVYIKGQVDDMVLEAAGTGNRDQIAYIYQDNSLTKWKLTMTAAGTTKLEKFTRASTTVPFATSNATGFPRNYTGATNGVIYSYDDIGDYTTGTGGLSGTVANSQVDGQGNPTDLAKLSICTRVEQGTQGVSRIDNYKCINIDGNILYANAGTTASVAPADAGVLGLVAGQVRITNKAELVENGVPTGSPTITGFKNRAASEEGTFADGATLDTLAVHATLMAYDKILVDNYDTRPVGAFRLLGGYIAQIGSPFGLSLGGADPLTMFNVRNGFQRILNYDRRVADEPPPFFPGTGQIYEVISYQRLLAPLQP